MKKFPVKEIRARRANRYAAVCRLDRFEKRATIRASTYAAPRKTARRGVKVRGDVSLKEGDDDSTAGDCVVQSNSYNKTAAHKPALWYTTR